MPTVIRLLHEGQSFLNVSNLPEMTGAVVEAHILSLGATHTATSYFGIEDECIPRRLQRRKRLSRPLLRLAPRSLPRRAVVIVMPAARIPPQPKLYVVDLSLALRRRTRTDVCPLALLRGLRSRSRCPVTPSRALPPHEQDSAESDADSPEPDSGLTNGASTSDSPSNGLPGSSSSTGGAGFELFADLPKAPELGWSPPDSTPSGSSSSSSPNNGEGSGSKQLPYMLAPPMTPAEKEAAMQRIMNGESIPPAANISPLEAGAVSWALNSLPSLEHLATGEDRRISGLPEDLVSLHSAVDHVQRTASLISCANSIRSLQNGLVNNRRAQDFKEKTLNLPFVSPDLAIVAEQYLSELNPQQRGADANGNGATGSVDGGWNGMTWGNMLDADLSNLDPLTAEYAMLDSERRLRQHLSGDISINQGDKF